MGPSASEGAQRWRNRATQPRWPPQFTTPPHNEGGFYFCHDKNRPSDNGADNSGLRSAGAHSARANASPPFSTEEEKERDR